MASILTALHHILPYCHIVHLRDIIEIICLSGALYYWSSWLRADRQKNLLLPFYSYCAVVPLTYALNLYALHSFLITAAPFALMAFILVHQRTLQHNFVALHSISVTQDPQLEREWPTELMRTFLASAHQRQNLVVVVEGSDSVTDWVSVPCATQTPLTHELLTIIINSTHYHPEHLLVIKRNGTLTGINGDWLQQPLGSGSEHDAYAQACSLTQHTDALVCYSNATSRSFNIVTAGTLQEHLSAAQTVALLKRCAGISALLPNTEKKGLYDQQSNSQKNIHEQSQP